MAYVVERNKRYTGYYNAEGKAKSAGTFSSRAKALNSALLAEEGGITSLPENQATVASYVEGVVSRTDVRASTKRHYLMLLKKYLVPAMGKARISAVTRKDIRNLLNDLKTQGVQPSTISHLKTAISYLFRQAVDNEEIPTNPAHQIRTPVSQPDPT